MQKLIIGFNKSGTHQSPLLLSSIMTSAVGSRWLEFDVVSAIRNWFTKPRHNFGFLVEVEHQDRTKVDAINVIKIRNCEESGNVIDYLQI